MKNGWKRIALVSTTIAALGGAAVVLEPYMPWAPKIAFVWAAENILARLDNQLFTLTNLHAQAKAANDKESEKRLYEQIKRLERKIKKVEKEADRQ